MSAYVSPLCHWSARTPENVRGALRAALTAAVTLKQYTKVRQSRGARSAFEMVVETMTKPAVKPPMKFKNDLKRAIEENPALQAFVFFTNVDLTPAIVEQLKEQASKAGMSAVDVVDLERLRHALY